MTSSSCERSIPCTGPASPTAPSSGCGTDASAWRTRSRRVCGARDAAGFDRFCRWVTRLYDVEMPNFIARNYDGPLDLIRPLAPAIELVRLGGFGRLAGKVGSFFARRAAAPVVQLPVDVCRAGALRGARRCTRVITYMDTIGGVFFPVTGSTRSPGAGPGGGQGGGDVPLRHRRRPHPPGRFRRRSSAWGATADRRPDRVRRRGLQRRPAGGVPQLLPGLAPPRAVRRAHYSPSCVVWHAGVRGDPPPSAAHHNIHFGRSWDDAFRALLDEGVRMPDPSTLVTVPTIDDDTAAPPGHALYVLEPVPNLDGRVDWASERDRVARAARRAGRRARLPDRRRRRGARRSAGLGAPGPRPRHPVRARRTGSGRPARSGPRTSNAGRRVSCSSARPPSPASACRWCSCPAGWPPPGSSSCGRDR